MSRTPIGLPWESSVLLSPTSSTFFLTLFVISFFVLGYLGTVTSTPARTLAAQIFTITYFAYFLLMPIYSKYETCKPVPDRVKLS